MYIKELIEADYVGEVLSCSLTTMRDGALARPTGRTWQRDASLGANTLTIANGHVIDALRFVAGDFARVSCMVSTQQGSGTRRTPSSTWKLPRRTTCGSAGSCRAARRHRSTWARRPGPAAATEWRFTGGRAPWSPPAASPPSGRNAAGAGRATKPPPGGFGDSRPLRLCPRRLPPGRPLQRGADVLPVRRGGPHRPEPPAHLRHGGGPAPLHRHHPGGVGYGAGVGGGVNSGRLQNFRSTSQSVVEISESPSANHTIALTATAGET